MLHNTDHGHGHKTAARPGHKSHAPAGKHSGPTYSKVFRWFPPEGLTEMPKLVEIVGTFTHWEPVALHHDKNSHAWLVTVPHIPSHKTHHYMLLADGKPVQDKNSDGLAVPHGAQEEKFAITTHRGPRVFMLFAQSK